MSETQPKSKSKKRSKSNSNKLSALVYVNAKIYSYPKERLNNQFKDLNNSIKIINEFNLHEHLNVSKMF